MRSRLGPLLLALGVVGCRVEQPARTVAEHRSASREQPADIEVADADEIADADAGAIDNPLSDLRLREHVDQQPPPAPLEPKPDSWWIERCSQSARAVRIPAAEGSARAQLLNDRTPDKYAPHSGVEPLRSPGLCVRIGDGDWQLVPREGSIQVPAHATALQRWEIDGGDYLIHVAPGRTFTLADCELCGWRFDGREFGSDLDRFCAANNCPGHQVAFLRDPEAWCEQPESIERTRCKARPKVRFSSVAHPKDSAPAPARVHPEIDHDEARADMTVWASPFREDWLIVREQAGQLVDVGGQKTRIPGHEVTLATGVGDDWTVWLDGDRLVGIANAH